MSGITGKDYLLEHTNSVLIGTMPTLVIVNQEIQELKIIVVGGGCPTAPPVAYNRQGD